MRYYIYQNNQWKEVPNFIFSCSLVGTITWCINDCTQQEKHSHPSECPQSKKNKKRYGIKELFSLKGLLTISIGTLLAFNIGECSLIEINNTKVWNYEDVEGVVENKKAFFRVAIVTQEFRWKLKKADSLETGLLNDELPKLISNLSGFNRMLGLISVGCASQEGAQETEIPRAELRADNVLLILRQHKKTRSNKFYKLNLGHYISNNNNNTETSVQRRVIIYLTA